jgi:hypothetical protein
MSMSAKQLKKLGVEMSGLCAELKRAKRLTKAERESLSHRAINLMEDLQMNYGVQAFRPEVPQATVTMFRALEDFYCESLS